MEPKTGIEPKKATCATSFYTSPVTSSLREAAFTYDIEGYEREK